jgi:hypothetical protein
LLERATDGKRREGEERDWQRNDKIMKWQMNSARHKWLATVAKTHFALCEARPLRAVFGLKSYILSLF